VTTVQNNAPVQALEQGQTIAEAPATGDTSTSPAATSARRRTWGRALALTRAPHAVTYAGVGLVVAGGLLLLYTWVKVAALALVWRQIPYLISSGCSGVCLVAVGLTVISVAARNEDANRRMGQAQELQALLAEMVQLLKNGTDTDMGRRT
jgi:hypothetical protein